MSAVKHDRQLGAGAGVPVGAQGKKNSRGLKLKFGDDVGKPRDDNDRDNGKSYTHRTPGGRPQFILIGPWTHGGHQVNKGTFEY
jgi:hypothetical protein